MHREPTLTRVGPLVGHREPAVHFVVALALVLAGGCRSPVGVTRTGFEPNFRAQRTNILDQKEKKELSPASLQLLAYTGLSDVYATDREEALRRLREIALTERRRRPFVVLAELDYAQALETGEQGRFLLAAVDAYQYLFSDELDPQPDPFDPLFRLACDLYNRGLAQALLAENGDVDLQNRVLETPCGPFEIRENASSPTWAHDEFERFLPADAFSIRGLRERVRTSGLGVPLIAVRNAAAEDDPLRKHMPPRLMLPATVVLRPEGGIAALHAGALTGALELHFTTDVQETEIAGHRVPLEADLTAPLAYSLQDSPIWSFSLLGFLSGENEKLETGVYMTQPYQAGKTPVLLLHGTASNPAEWAQLISGLQLDQRLRANYQLWVGLYPTGNPVLYSAWGVRTALSDLLRELDPEGDDPALARMVVVGHSQGGLLARLLVSSSGDRFWKLISSKPFEEYELSSEAREILGGCLFFEPVPAIQRAVFISTPHKGSFLAASWIGRLTYGLVELPRDLTNSARQLVKADRLPAELRKEIPTSVQNMDPASHFVKVLSTLPFGEGVHLHSIVAVNGDGPAEEGDDGVVAYESAHLDEAESELVVRHSHSCQHEPETVLELRRILLEHLGSMLDAPKARASQP
jgi:pimeloyl-ACP methyl ester carboxylesterase